jgi:hypothetical protein
LIPREDASSKDCPKSTASFLQGIPGLDISLFLGNFPSRVRGFGHNRLPRYNSGRI